MALCFTYRPSHSHVASSSHGPQSSLTSPQQQRQAAAMRSATGRPASATVSCVDLLTAF